MTDSAPTLPAVGTSLKRIPGRSPRVLKIADIRAEPQTHARADRRQDDIVISLESHADAAHKIGRAVNASKPVV